MPKTWLPVELRAQAEDEQTMIPKNIDPLAAIVAKSASSDVRHGLAPENQQVARPNQCLRQHLHKQCMTAP